VTNEYGKSGQKIKLLNQPDHWKIMNFLEKFKNKIQGELKPEYHEYPEVAIEKYPIYEPDYQEVIVELETENPLYAHLPSCPECGRKTPLSKCGVCDQKLCPACFDKHRCTENL
jgi:hypothetical protein